MEIKTQQVRWNQKTNQCYLDTLYEDGSMESQKITSEQASEWHARLGGY